MYILRLSDMYVAEVWFPYPTTDESLVVHTSKKNLLQPFDKISISTKSFVFARLNIDNNVNWACLALDISEFA